MIQAFDYVISRPWLAFSVGCLCLADAANCVFLGHADWWFPAATAAAIGVFMRGGK